MRNLNRVFLVVLAVALLVSAPHRTSHAVLAAIQPADLREPFVLELPELDNRRITAPDADIPTADLHTLRLVVRKPFSDSINYGKIYTKINGESAGTIQGIKSGNIGHLVTLDLESKPRFRLHPGKNVVEISATGRDGRSYYASYVLIAGGRPAGDPSLVASATIESVPVATGDDRQPPMIYLIEPKSAVRLPGGAGTLTVKGVVTDDSGVVASVTVNGQMATLAPRTSTRALSLLSDAVASSAGMVFECALAIEAKSSSVIIEAKDRAGNLTRLTIPVRRPEAAISSRFTGNKFALVIGVSKYKYHDGGLNDLAYADADARTIRDFLLRPEGGNFAPANLHYLENSQATIGAVRAELKTFLRKALPDDLIFLFIAGHGAPDPYAPQNLYFILHDTKVADMPNTALPMTDLQEVLDHGVRAQRVVVFIDTCHSAGLSGEKLVATRGLENNLVNLYAAKLFKEAGRAVLTSSDVNEVSREDNHWGGGHGIFTWALLEGLRGEADANADNLITAGELFTYVRDRVRIETAFRQNPRALPGLTADLTLAAVSKK